MRTAAKVHPDEPELAATFNALNTMAAGQQGRQLVACAALLCDILTPDYHPAVSYHLLGECLYHGMTGEDSSLTVAGYLSCRLEQGFCFERVVCLLFLVTGPHTEVNVVDFRILALCSKSGDMLNGAARS